jgi:hypothetical protein
MPMKDTLSKKSINSKCWFDFTISQEVLLASPSSNEGYCLTLVAHYCSSLQRFSSTTFRVLPFGIALVVSG